VNEVTLVALYALAYREAYKHHCWAGEHLIELYDCAPGDVSLATLLGSQLLNRQDSELLCQLDEADDFMRLARKIVRRDPFRAEVLLHACPPHGRRSRRPWAAALVARWDDVRRARLALRDEGLTATRDDVEELAVAAYSALTGKTHSDYLDECEDQMFLEYAHG
jgi:hypothetical protein